MKKFKIFYLFLIISLLTNCKSTEKYNKQVSKLHSVEELHQDIDYAYKKLKKWHPNLYQYIKKEELDAAFNNLKSRIKSPKTTIEFYNEFAPIIAKIGQGHTALKVAHKWQTKKDLKKRGNRENPFRILRFNTLNEKVFIQNNFGKDTTIIKGSELLKIEKETVQFIYNSSKNIVTGDGYNKTFLQKFPYKNIGMFYTNTHTLKDSLLLTLKYNDSIYKKYIYAYTKKEPTKKKDSIIAKKKLNKAERKIAKKKKKERQKWEQKYGYNKLTKENTLSLNFIKTKDSSKTVAMMKIRSFSSGNHEKFYAESFKKIDSAKVDNLIIDIRDNLGGELFAIADLYSYLVTEDHYFISPSKMTKANSFSYPLFYGKSKLIKGLLLPITFPLAKTIQAIMVKKINGEPHFVFKSAKLQKAKEEHNFNGKIYVLINASSFSASTVLSNKLQATKRAFFVGEETGGAYNSTVAGILVRIELPNSKNYIRSGLMVLDTPHKTTPDGYGIKPDKYIEVTTLNQDEQLDWILNDIAK